MRLLIPLLLLASSGCSLLVNPDTIPRPDAGVCQPSCTGVPCGESDGCGGLCGAGSSCMCTASCTGVLCGMSDGCNGTCTINNSSCLCTPTCAGKPCGANDGCRDVCLLGSGCNCTSTCEMVPCGFDDGCGTACAPGSGCTPPRNTLRELRVELLSSPDAPQDDGGVPDGDGGTLPPSTHRATLHSGSAAASDLTGSNYRLERLEVSP